MYSASLRSSILNEIEHTLNNKNVFETTNRCFLFNKTKISNNGDVIYRVRFDGKLKSSYEIPNCSFVKYQQTYNSPEYYAYYSGYMKGTEEDSIWYTVCNFKDEYLESLAKYCSDDLANYDLYLKSEGNYILFSKKTLSFNIYNDMVSKYKNIGNLVFVLLEESDNGFKYSVSVE